MEKDKELYDMLAEDIPEDCLCHGGYEGGIYLGDGVILLPDGTFIVE